MQVQTAVAHRTRTIVVADDTAFVRDRFRAALERAGHRVLAASTRTDLLNSIRDAATLVDLVALDVRLSGTSPAALIRQLRALLPHDPPIVVFSGTVGDRHLVETLAGLHVTAYINEYTAEPNIVRALEPFLSDDPRNRRRSPRVTLGAAVSFRYGHTIATGVTLNISRGGLAIRSTNPLTTGTAVRVRVKLPSGGGDVDGDAVVVWSTPGVGMGLQFTSLSEDHQRMLDDFVVTHFFSSRRA